MKWCIRWVLGVLAGCLLLGEAWAAPSSPNAPKLKPVARGLQLLHSEGCLSCHSLNGTPMAGPTLYRLAGKQRTVWTQGAWRNVPADAAYLRRAILEPGREQVKGFRHVSMPPYRGAKQNVGAMVAALLSLGDGTVIPSSKNSSTWLWVVLFVCLLLLGLVLFGRSVLFARGATPS
ncbi:MAG: c-type cytochrome [Deltaproteobacteria bacterium]|nr:MAG: c-type cytochrome [Deltaproteobacteria bacterium]